MSKIVDKIKGIGLGVVEKYALIQLDAKEKRDKKNREKKRSLFVVLNALSNILPLCIMPIKQEKKMLE